MRTLAIETATEACSVALFDHRQQIDARHETIGRGHVERLVPMIAELPGKGRADRILVSLGPGSFTGARVGIATARALGIAWGAEVLGYPTLALVAAMKTYTGALLPGSQDVRKPHDVLVCMAGGHGEWLVQPFTPAGDQAGPWRSLSPEEAVAEFDHAIVVGSRAADFVALRGHGEAVALLPNAARAMAIGGNLLTSKVHPIYGRPPDARLPA